MMLRAFHMLVALAVVLAVPSWTAAVVTFLPPTPYLSVEDSPFDRFGFGTTYFFEDFEDGAFDLPLGVTPFPGGIQFPDTLTDSVDGDDGMIDGSGIEGHSFKPTFTIAGPSNPPVWWTTFQLNFDETQLGFLPNAAGLVWTDGMPNSRLIVTVRDGDGNLTITNFTDLMDQSHTGETYEDRFIGVTSDRGLTLFAVDHQYHGEPFTNHFEIDHIQFGLFVPEPRNGLVGLLGLVTLMVIGRHCKRKCPYAKSTKGVCYDFLTGSTSKSETCHGAIGAT